MRKFLTIVISLLSITIFIFLIRPIGDILIKLSDWQNEIRVSLIESGLPFYIIVGVTIISVIVYLFFSKGKKL